MIDPVCFRLGSRPIYWFGIMMALAFMAAMSHWTLLGRKTSRDTSIAGDLALWLMVGGIVGARIAYIVANIHFFMQAPMEMIRVDQGGLVYYGGFIGATITLIILARCRHESFLSLVDFTVTALPLGHALGRIGCFLNGCCHGRDVATPSFFTAGLSRYPVQLFESAFNVAVYLLLLRLYIRKTDQTPPGTLLAIYLIVYPAGRFLLEFLRGDDRLRAGHLDVAQIISLGFMMIGLIMWTILRRCHERNLHRPS
jgi:phosphatidylglycerol:prolipoprotein diacylglycerol transferase